MSLLQPSQRDPGRVLARVREWSGASTSELAGLAILLVGALVASGLILFRSGPAVPAAPASPGIDAVPTGAARILVHVTGAVVSPGLVELSEGARVSDAVEAAGGFSLGAATDALNLARQVSDGEQLVVPGPGAKPARSARSGVVDAEGRLDLNRATAEDLEELPGIGPVLASRIVSWRDEHGPFTDPGQLREVPGIGERTFQTLADLVRV
ncbi:MAG: ComEA family DNA-binding protein [Nitriliruptorales bacterium]|nr:ComEA family DNA-binding protein [Nitriliruptorales bacterium]